MIDKTRCGVQLHEIMTATEQGAEKRFYIALPINFLIMLRELSQRIVLAAFLGPSAAIKRCEGFALRISLKQARSTQAF
jgi:hypothetical protein